MLGPRPRAGLRTECSIRIQLSRRESLVQTWIDGRQTTIGMRMAPWMVVRRVSDAARPPPPAASVHHHPIVRVMVGARGIEPTLVGVGARRVPEDPRRRSLSLTLLYFVPVLGSPCSFNRRRAASVFGRHNARIRSGKVRPRGAGIILPAPEPEAPACKPFHDVRHLILLGHAPRLSQATRTCRVQLCLEVQDRKSLWSQPDPIRVNVRGGSATARATSTGG
jgi:hypothetical protein